ncbi:hypothetical protein ACSBR2_038819 [Camellia fascicularis]
MGRKLQAPPSPPPPPPPSASPESTYPAPPPSSSAMSGEERVSVDRRTDYSVVCKWTIPNLERTKSKAVYSPYLEVGTSGVDCRLVVYPRGHSDALPGSLSLYLHVIDPPRTSKLGCFTYYKLSILNSLDESKSLHRDSYYRFTSKRKSHGWSDFTLSSTVLDPQLGFISNNFLFILADIRVLNESTSFVPDTNESKLASSSLSVSSGQFTWTIKNFSLFREMIKTHKLLSPSFPAEECNLRISVHRYVADKVEYLYLCLDSKEMENLTGFEYRSCWCMFRMSVLNHKSGSKSIHRDLHGRFGTDVNFGDTTYIGWCNYMKMSKFIGLDNGFLVDDTAVFSVSFQAIKESSGCLKITRTPAVKNSIMPSKPDWYQGGFVWKIKNFTRLKDLMKKRKIVGLAVNSRRFQIGNQDFHLGVYPRGLSQPPSHFSFYLQVDNQNSSPDWSCFVSYRLSVKNQRSMDKSVSKDSLDRFSNATKELGWCEFLTLNSLLDQDSGFVVGNTIHFCAEVLLLKETFLKGNTELRNAGFPVDHLSGEGEFVLWILHNFMSFIDILETRKIVSPAFEVGGFQLQIGVCKSLDSICAFLECNPSVTSDSDKNFLVSYKMSLANQKNYAKSMWKETTFCTKSNNNSVIQFMKVSDMVDADAGYLAHESVAILCQILDHCPSLEFSEPGTYPSSNVDDSQNAFSNDRDEFTHSKFSEVNSEIEDDIFESILFRAGLDIALHQDSCSESCIRKKIWMGADWMCHTMNKLCIYLGEPVKAKDLLSAVKNLVCCDVNRHAESPPFLMNLWTVVKISQQAIIDLLLDIMVESCQHSETRSSVDCYDSSLKPSGHTNGDASEGQFLRQSGPEDSGQSAKYETLASWVDGSSSMCAVEGLEEEITDIPEKAILAKPPSELSAIALLKINSIQDLKIKWPEQADEILDMIFNSLKALDGTIPKGGLRPNQWLVSVQKISRALDRAPKHLQPDLVTLVPKLVDHSDNPLAASVLLDQLTKPDADPEIQARVFDAISQLEFSSEVWEHVFFVTSKVVEKFNDGALATIIGFLFKAASHCQHISEAAIVVHARLCSMGVEVSPCVLIFLSETVRSCSDIAMALLRDIDFGFELDDKFLASSGEPFLCGEDKLLTRRLNMMDDQVLDEGRHFSDIYILIEMLSVPSLTNEAFQTFERAVAQGSIVVQSVAMVFERRHSLRLNIGPMSSAGKNQQTDEVPGGKIEPFPVEEDDFALLLGLAERFSLSNHSRVQQFAQMLYATLFRLFADESYYKRMLKGLVDRAINLTENGHQADKDFNTLLFLVNKERVLAGAILNMMREVAKAANADCATLRHQLSASEDHNLRIQEERHAEHADMVREKAILLERLCESEATTNNYKSELKLEIDRFATEKKELSKRMQEMESQFEWFQSEQNDEIMKLSEENKVYKDRLHNLETQLSQLKSRSSDDLKILVKEKNSLAERLKIAEAARKKSDEILKHYYSDNRILQDNKHSLEDEVRQLKATVGQLEQEKLDKEEKIKQCEMYIGGMEQKLGAWQKHIHSLEVSLREEMSQHAPLYGVGLEDLSMKELDTLSSIHQQGLEQIYVLQQQKANLAANPPANPNTFPSSSRS